MNHLTDQSMYKLSLKKRLTFDQGGARREQISFQSYLTDETTSSVTLASQSSFEPMN